MPRLPCEDVFVDGACAWFLLYPWVMNAVENPETGVARPETATREHAEAARPKRLPPYAVILHNDNLNTFEFVIETIQKVFHYDEQRATKLTMEAHRTGRAAVWSGQKEHAELKAELVRSRGADPVMRDRGAMPLRVTIEAMPQ